MLPDVQSGCFMKGLGPYAFYTALCSKDAKIQIRNRLVYGKRPNIHSKGRRCLPLRKGETAKTGGNG